MEFVFSNLAPVKFTKKSLYECFEDNFVRCDSLRIATGYISSDSIIELKKVFEDNKKKYLQLIIGMHYFEGFTKSQYAAVKHLNDFLDSKHLGEVYVSNVKKFHGKIYSFLKNDTPFAGIIGSSNLSGILDVNDTYETNLLVDEIKLNNQIIDFFDNYTSKACGLFNKVPIKKYKPDSNELLENLSGVTKIKREQYTDYLSKLTGLSFKIPVKSDESTKSNLNVYFGEGRKDKRGLIKPRHWYEVELIVPKSIASHPSYPKTDSKNSLITVITDDMWSFECKISGTNSKNFRSAKDLKILGRWMKGRLENSGALNIGELVTKDVLRKYGRDNFELKATTDPKVWLIDFKV